MISIEERLEDYYGIPELEGKEGRKEGGRLW